MNICEECIHYDASDLRCNIEVKEHCEEVKDCEEFDESDQYSQMMSSGDEE